GDYLAIVTLGFGEIVPQLFYNFDQWTGGINAVGGIDQPTLPAWIQGPWSGDGPFQVVRNFNFGGDPVAFYVLICILIAAAIILLVMVVLGGMGNLSGVIIGALVLYYVVYYLIPGLPENVRSLANSIGLSSETTRSLADATQHLNYIIYGGILVAMMLLRPQGLLPSRVREQELKHAAVQEEEAAVEMEHAT